MGLFKRLRASWLLTALIVTGVLSSILLSTRPLTGYSILRIEEIATLPDTPELADVRRYTEIGSGFMPHVRGGRSDLDPRAQPLKIGWIYQEGGMLSLPYFARNVSTGPVLYIDTGEGYQMAGIGRRQMPLLEQKAGRSFSDYQFRWYLHVWGWLFPLALLLLLLLWRKEARAREEEEWRAETAVAPADA